jgi:hypothetical protein
MQSGRNDASTQLTRLVALNFRVPLELRRRLRIVAAERGVTMTSLVLDTLHAVIDRERKEDRKDSLNDRNEF